MHPEVPAISVCSRCGRFCCAPCAQTRVDGTVFCVGCYHREPLPWDASISARAFIRTAGALLLQPGRAVRLYEPAGGLARSAVFAAVCLSLFLFALCVGLAAFLFWGEKLKRLATRSVGAGSAEPEPVQVVLDLWAWSGRSWPYLVLIVIAVVLLDWSGLSRSAGLRGILRASFLALVPLMTAWLAVAAMWAGALLFENTINVGRAALVLLSLSLPLWCLAAIVGWFRSRWHLLPWVADGASSRAKWIAAVNPLIVLLAAIVLTALT